MTRQLEQQAEERFAKRKTAIVKAVEFGISDALQLQGHTLTGIAFKFSGGDCLAVVKSMSEEGPQVCFVGAEDFGSTMIKIVSEAARDRLRWRADEYVGVS